MVNIPQIVLGLASFPFNRKYASVQDPLSLSGTNKSIAIVGAGSAGLAALKTLLDLPELTRTNWEIVLYEQRRSVGGIWLPDPEDPQPPNLPETPLYPALRTNTPHPFMTYQSFPFPPLTPLYPTHDYVEAYHQHYAEHFKLTPHIHFNHSVERSEWLGDGNSGVWNISVKNHYGNLEHKAFDHLIVANGHNFFPNVPTWPGQDAWLANSPPGGPKREIRHAVYWRTPGRYENRTVLVLGGGASGRDAVLHTTPVAKKLYLSLKKQKDAPDLPFPIPVKAAVSHFTPESVVFEDGTTDSEIDSLILATGYHYRVPFLERGDALVVDPSAKSNQTYSKQLTTNLRYIFPLHQHIFSLSPHHPPSTLSFIGLPMLIANCPSDIAQALAVAHAIANSTLLPSREEMLDHLQQKEGELRTAGFDPYYVGHRLVGPGGDHGYQDEVVDFLKLRGALPNDGKKFVEAWRRRTRTNAALLKRGWTRVERLGTEMEWIRGIETEEDWADLLDRLAVWEAEMELNEGIAL